MADTPPRSPGSGGRYKVDDRDFEVFELPFGCPPGRGIDWYRVRRAGRDTPEVARALARAADVPSEAVGYSGLKDRDAVTEQRFTIEGGRRLRTLPSGLELVASGQTREPLRPGALEGNRFRIRVRGGHAGYAAARLAELPSFPNRFGPQRVGGDLPELGRELLLGRAGRLDPQRARFALIGWQAAGFNRVLHVRGTARIDGDLLDAGVPTGPLYGAQMRWPRGAAKVIEEGVLAEAGIGMDELERVSRIVPGSRRPLSARALDARIVPDEAGYVLEVTLAPGVYATTLLEELL